MHTESTHQEQNIVSGGRTCPLCSGKSLQRVFTGAYTGVGINNYPFSLLTCPACKLTAVDPLPSNATYPVGKDASGEHVGPVALEDTYPWNLPLLRNVQRYKQAGELLDLGCNAGEFMTIAEKNGFRCTGYEIDETASRAGQKLNRNIHCEDFLRIAPSKNYDVIVMNHVLEHIPDFTEVPAALARFLKSDGVVIINIPYFQSIIGQILKNKWSQMAPFTHTWFHSKGSIQKLFSPHFDEISFHTDSICEPHTIRTLNWRPLLKGLFLRFFALVHRGDELRIVLRRPNHVSPTAQTS